MRVIIVGAGAIGLTCALRLAERGAEILVLDGEAHGAEPTRGASRAAAGMLAPLSESMVEKAGAHPRLLELGLESLHLWRPRGEMLDLSTFPARGATWIGTSQEIETLAARAQAHQSRAERFGDATIHLADEAALDPAETLVALELALRSFGGDVRRGAAVVEASAREVRCSNGTRETADVIVLATGLGAPDLAPHASVLTPMKGQLLDLQSALLAPGETLRARDIYAVGRAEDRVVIGASMEAGRTDQLTDAATLDALAARAGALSPALANAPRLRAWAGVRPMSMDWAPRVGRVGEAIVARGHSRNGWLLAPITAEMVCAYVFEEDIPRLWAEFAP